MKFAKEKLNLENALDKADNAMEDALDKAEEKVDKALNR